MSCGLKDVYLTGTLKNQNAWLSKVLLAEKA